ncbi:MAG: leucine-rich repeat protein [Bacteroidales bacterium]|nr:leucine-rich repeat protein [Bacteroidales bacterium]
MKKAFFLVVILLGILLCYSCEKTPEEISVESVSLSQATAEMYIGETTQLKATVLPSNASDKTVTWASSKQSVATVSDNGLVTAVAEGTSTITASAGGKSATCSIQVSKKVVEVSSVELDKTAVELVEGEIITLVATVKPDDATDKTVSWNSTDTAVASVVENGKVTAIKEGKATITAKAGGKQASCLITVAKRVIAVESITLNKSELSLEKGKSETLVATVKPDDASDKSVTWSSSDDKVASVDQAGKVTAVGGGEATITAKGGEKTATCKVSVSVPVESVSLNNTSLTLKQGQSATLVATVKPNDATDKSVSWSSSDSSIAQVDQNGKVSAVKEGSATITAKAGEKQATCKITVQKQVIAVESVSLNQTSLTLEEGQFSTLTAIVKPDNATNKTVTWSSSAPENASVDQNGKVSALKAGSATITAKAGEKEATCKVTVQEKPKVSSITFNTDSFNGNIGSKFPISITISPVNAQYDLEWSASDTRVASVQGNGTSATIRTNDYGITEITVKDKISGKTASITVSTVVNDFTWTENTGETYSGYPLITIEVGAEHQLKYSCSPSSATHIFSDLSQFTFYEPYVVDAPSCITISEEGLVRGIKEGTVGIKATGRVIKGASGPDRIYIKVKPAAIPVTGITLNKTSLTLKEGQSETLTATVSPSNATNKTVSWSSNKTSVAQVDQSGKVTAVGVGTASITAMAGNISATCNVTVQQNTVAVTSVTLNKTSLNLKVGESETLTATVKPDNATDKTVIWASTNTAAATVDQNGKVTALAVGTASITANAGNITATCAVTVSTASSSDPNNISFADSNLKAKLVAAFDTNSDGELSYAEAAAVTSGDAIKAAFGNIKTYKSFDEFQYFTGIPSIINEMFSSWNLLSSIVLPEQIQSIGASAFNKCIKLSSIVVPGGITQIADHTFDGCISLTSIVIPDSVNSIGNYAFSGCSSLASINIPISVTSIGNSAFSGCSSLTSFAIPNGVSKISQYTFNYCTNLSSITIPESITRVDKYAFAGCSNLRNIHINNLTAWLKIDFHSMYVHYLHPFSVSGAGRMFLDGVELTDVSIPEGVSTIGYHAFYGCTSIKTVSIPNSVSIISQSFEGCSNLVSVSIPESVTDIGWAFIGCTSLTSITIPESVTNISGAFKNCTSLASVTIPESVINMELAFCQCTGLTAITIPEGVTNINGAFQNCTNLASVTIPKSVAYMESAFCQCTSLTAITIPDGVRNINQSFFACTNLTSVTIPDSVIYMSLAFSDCTSLTSITIPKGIQELQYTFCDCTNLSSVTIPEGVKSIEGAFSGCTSLTSITIPESVTSISYGAFSGCTSLTSITIPECITSISDRSFKGCRHLKNIIVKALSVPTGGYQMFDDTNNCPIYVPAVSVNAYKTAGYWSNYASRIQAIPE